MLGITVPSQASDGLDISNVPAPSTFNDRPGFPQTPPLLRLPTTAVGSTAWTELGPKPIVAASATPNYYGQAPFSGRVTAIAVNASNTQNIYLGSAGGGVWKSTDGGNTWAPITDGQASLATGVITLSPDQKTIYVGTGEPNHSGDSYAGAGILKSTDGGRTWTLLGSQLFRGSSISGLIVNQANPSRIIVSTTTGSCCRTFYRDANQSGMGVYLSTDAGVSWTPTFLSHSIRVRFSALVASAANSNTVFAGSFNGTVWRSTDGGGTWSRLFHVTNAACATSTSCRVALATTAAQPNNLYAAVSDSFGFLYGIYRVDTTTIAITGLSFPPNPPNNSDPCGSGSSGQCDYDLVMAADPSTANTLYFGALDMYRSTDGGSSWVDRGGYFDNFIHPDQHVLVFVPGSGAILDGNDGGIWMSATQGASWTNLNSGLGTVQMESISGSPTGYLLGGNQDNGCVKYTGSISWPEVKGGDGGWTGVEATNTNIAYCNYTFLDFRESNDAGQTWYKATIGINLNDNSEFYAPAAMDPSKPGTIYMGGTHLYRTSNFASSWTDVSGLLGPAVISAIAVAPSDSSRVYLGDDAGNLKVSSDGGSTWQTISTQQGSIAGIAVDPTDSKTIYVAVAYYSTAFKFSLQSGIWQSTQLSSASDRINMIRINSAKTLFVATDHGVLYSTDSGASWASPGTGLPKVAVFDIEVTASNQVIAATHGRGVWMVTPTPPTVTSLTLSFSVNGGGSGYSAPTLTYVSGGAQQTVSLTASPSTFYLDVGSTWMVTNPLVGSSSTERWQTSMASSGIATSPQTIALNYYHQYLVSISYAILGAGNPGPPSLSFSSFGSGSLLALSGSSQSFWADAGSTYSSTNPLAGSTSTERWYSPSPNGTIQAAGSLQLSYRHQYLLTIVSTTTSSLWLDEGSQSVSVPGISNRAGGVGLRVGSVSIDGGPPQKQTPTGGNITLTVTINAAHTLTLGLVRQYQVSMDSATARAVSSITSPTIPGDNYWYDSGSPVSLVLRGVFGRSAGVGSRLAAYSVNGGTPVGVSTAGTVDVLSVGSISSPQSIITTIFTQYQLSTPTGSVAQATPPAVTGDVGWYDSGTPVGVSYDYVWNTVRQQSRLVATGYSVDGGATTAVARGSVGTFQVSVTMDSAHSIDLKYVTQYFVSFQFDDALGKRTIVPSHLELVVDGQRQAVPGFALWLDSGTSFTIANVAYQGVDVRPQPAQQYTVTAASAIVVKDVVYDVVVRVTDIFGLAVSGAQVRMTLANGTVLSGETGGDGEFLAAAVPLGTFTASVSGIASSTQVSGDASRQAVAIAPILFSVASLGIIVGAAVVVAILAFFVLRKKTGVPRGLSKTAAKEKAEAAPLRCPSCGSAVEASDPFCTICGARLH